MAVRCSRLLWSVIVVVPLSCQQSHESPSAPPEPTAQARSNLGPSTLDIQGIGDAYAGWVVLNEDHSMWLSRPGGDVGVTTVAQKVEVLGNDVASIANVDGESLTFCAVKSDHTLWCWGANTHGQVGDGSGQPDVNEPTKVPIPGDNVASAVTGGEHACALTVDGRVFCWGMNEYGQIGNGTATASDVLQPVEITSLGNQVERVSAGFEHTCALMKDRTLYCWGHNVYGEIGDGTSQEANIADAIKPTPLLISSLGTDVAEISAGGFFTCAIRNSDLSLWCWGDNTEGHLATGDTINRTLPTKSVMVGPWLDVDTGVVLGCGLKVDGSAWCWGRDELGQLGTPNPATQICPGIGGPCSPVPQAVQGVPAYGVKISVKDHGVCVVMDDGELRCWGAGNFLDGGGQTSSAVVVDYMDLCEAADCTGANPICATSGTCEPCTEDDQCPSQTPACLPSGQCAECSVLNSTACLNTSTPMCDPATNTCVGCIENEDCVGTPSPICDPVSKECRVCATDTDCPAGAPACQPTGQCGECSSTNLSLCTAPYVVCQASTGTCVGCLEDADCTDTDAPHCDGTVNLCRECLTNDHCTPLRPFCDDSGTCSGCLSDADCPSTLPICSPSGSCSQCSSGRTELCTGGTPLCDEEEYACVQCLSDADCTRAGEGCDLDSKLCTTSAGVVDPNQRYGACVDRIATGSDPDKGHIGALAAALAAALMMTRRRRG